MALAGWYPDPGGKPGRYRYWDGESWSEVMTDDPADPPPGAGTGRRPTPDADHHHPGRTIGIAVLVLVIVVVSAVLIVRRTDNASSIGAPGAGASGWDDSSPLPSSPAGGSPSTSGSSGPPRTAVNCPAGRPDELSLHPNDGRIHGGRLSMAPIDGYSDPEPEYMLSWMWDTEGVSQVTEPGWQSIFAVGEIQRSDGFDSLRDAARSSLDCAKRTGWYLHLAGSKNIRDEATKVDGRDAWIVTAEIRDDSPRVRVDGDQLTFVVVDDGRDGAYSVWCGMVPLGDRTRLALSQRVLSGLKVRG
ncbi:DUF2510 domain-containing protein [Microlunatus soli]|uniref:DUF2510 domain-containing protein n=1 Tax=Microlunatus soli TaxID=630515 RepID=A0A1H1Q3L1_9ACTN|nr:DUF2510 domain-containing protein [Microlunatus soli]SDS17990.1 Protein of unknown function [Microlunatus soli]